MQSSATARHQSETIDVDKEDEEGHSRIPTPQGWMTAAPAASGSARPPCSESYSRERIPLQRTTTSPQLRMPHSYDDEDEDEDDPEIPHNRKLSLQNRGTSRAPAFKTDRTAQEEDRKDSKMPFNPNLCSRLSRSRSASFPFTATSRAYNVDEDEDYKLRNDSSSCVGDSDWLSSGGNRMSLFRDYTGHAIGSHPETVAGLPEPSKEPSAAGVPEQEGQQPGEEEEAHVDDDANGWEAYHPEAIPKSDRPPLFSLEEFEGMIGLAAEDFGSSVADIESGKLVRAANAKMTTSEQSGAMYGRILPHAVQDILKRILRVLREDVFIDVGHGIGLISLQAAFTVGCESRGIEVDETRHLIAKLLEQSFQHQLEKHHKGRDNRETDVGAVRLERGELQSPAFRDFLTKVEYSQSDRHENGDFAVNENSDRRRRGGVIKAFCNNYGQNFKDKASKSIGQLYCLDDFVAGLFASMSPGSVLVTLDKLRLGPSRSDANKIRRARGLKESADASYFEMEEHRLGESRDVASWGTSDAEIMAYKYTRLKQSKFAFCPRAALKLLFLSRNFSNSHIVLNGRPRPAVGGVSVLQSRVRDGVGG